MTLVQVLQPGCRGTRHHGQAGHCQRDLFGQWPRGHGPQFSGRLPIPGTRWKEGPRWRNVLHTVDFPNTDTYFLLNPFLTAEMGVCGGDAAACSGRPDDCSCLYRAERGREYLMPDCVRKISYIVWSFLCLSGYAFILLSHPHNTIVPGSDSAAPPPDGSRPHLQDGAVRYRHRRHRCRPHSETGETVCLGVIGLGVQRALHSSI